MAKQARERAVREKRALKAERKRLRLAGDVDVDVDTSELPPDLNARHGLHLVSPEESAVPETTAAPEPAGVEANEGDLHGAHA
jgi:hypothetical protein